MVRVWNSRTASRNHRRIKRTEADVKRLKKKGMILSGVLTVFAILAAVIYVADKKDIFSLDQFLNPKLYNVTEINGVSCRRRTRIKSYLFMGIDAKGKVGEFAENQVGSGQCDVLELVIIDQNADTYTVFPINRNIVTEVKGLDENGNLLGEGEVQLSLAHSGGDGREISCENVVEAVSHLLYDQPIDGYLALNMDSIGVINHELGGVTVTIEDDFSRSDPSLKMGETVKLTDEQAVSFVRHRMTVGDGTNEGRMRRQEQYLANAQPILEEKIMEDEKFFRSLYDALGDYMVTSLSGKDISKLAKALRSNEYLEPPQIEGETLVDRFGSDQLIPDEESVAAAVLELFYEEV